MHIIKVICMFLGLVSVKNFTISNSSKLMAANKLGRCNWEDDMKTWTKPAASTVDAGFEVTRYLPSTLDVAAKRACK
jgi:coenzyme PQQ precursor peptide PqqA